MKKMIILSAIIFSWAYADVNCDSHPIYCHIIELRPNINKTFAMKLSNKLYKYSQKYETDPHISVAIAMQESSLRNINRRATVLVKDKNNYTLIKGYSDIGIFQFHVLTAKNYKMDIVRLVNDLDYAVDRHVWLLKRKMQYCKHLGDESWTCYHSATPIHRKVYKKHVERYFR